MKFGLNKTNSTGWWVLASLVLCCACHHDYLSYNVNQKDGVYMELRDSFLFKFYKRDSIVTDISLRVLGFPRDYDREINIELIDTLTTAEEGIHYRFGDKVVLKAGEIKTYVPLIFYRKKDPDFRGKQVAVGIRLKENKDFQLVPGIGDRPFRAMIAGEIIDRPGWWNDAYLGPFSEVLYNAFMDQFDSLETTNPAIHKTIFDYTLYWGDAINSPKVWTMYEYPMVKFIVHPLFDYYQKNPHPEVNIPTPKY
ncbi:DUF4843 domain-containing protein [Butyricimonas hominis]|uniref:DUF4843 domain-containing protein n=1 Tax=Butyricimonas hominis TaxID=2763032 RepID=A0ABR7D5A0_9BACT|nr:DUF4843 domain-containing protein [Butyricimonas hominis]MBC5623069.1 DUF4843 domain-containing protein [Butyricimonas hominis]